MLPSRSEDAKNFPDTLNAISRIVLVMEVVSKKNTKDYHHTVIKNNTYC